MLHFSPSFSSLPFSFCLGHLLHFKTFIIPPINQETFTTSLLLIHKEVSGKKSSKKVSFLYNLHTFLDTSKGVGNREFCKYFLLPLKSIFFPSIFPIQHMTHISQSLATFSTIRFNDISMLDPEKGGNFYARVGKKVFQCVYERRNFCVLCAGGWKTISSEEEKKLLTWEKYFITFLLLSHFFFSPVILFFCCLVSVNLNMILWAEVVCDKIWNWLLIKICWGKIICT